MSTSRGRHIKPRKKTGVVLVLLGMLGIIFGLSGLFAPPASAHTPGHSASCGGVTATAEGYRDGATLTVDVDGVGPATHHVDHNGAVSVDVPQDAGVHHWTASVIADNPKENSNSWEGSVGPCGDVTSPSPTPSITPTPTPSVTPTPSETPSSSPSTNPTPPPPTTTPTTTSTPTPAPPTVILGPPVHITEKPKPKVTAHRKNLPSTGGPNIEVLGGALALIGFGGRLLTGGRKEV